MKVHHLMSETPGRAACGQNLGLIDQGGEVGGDLPSRSWEAHHVAQSAVGLLAEADERGPRDVCWRCALTASQRLQERLPVSSGAGLAPAWALDADEFARFMQGGWPDAVDEAAMSEDEWAMRRPVGWDGGGTTIRIEDGL